MTDNCDKAFLCKHRNDETGICNKINHEILSGNASITHCGHCEHFEE